MLHRFAIEDEPDLDTSMVSLDQGVQGSPGRQLVIDDPDGLLGFTDGFAPGGDDIFPHHNFTVIHWLIIGPQWIPEEQDQQVSGK